MQAQAGNADARRRAALACLSVFAVNVREALKGVRDAKGASLETATVTQHASRLENLGARLAQDPAAPLFAASTEELGEGFAIEVAADIGALANALALPPGAKLPKPDTFTPKREEAGKAMLAFQFVSAVEAEPAIRAALAKQQRDEIEKAVTSKFQDALVAERLTTQDYASEIFVLDKPKPRFFISTGVMAAAFNDDWQLALPIIASICVTTAGCETKGAGSGGNQGNYFSLDLGVKTVRIGGDDRREGAPSLLIGFGATPFYATHFSLGLNVFSNRQSDTPRANAAAYFAVTLDTIDGADILGSLGVGKPEVKPIGGTSAIRQLGAPFDESEPVSTSSGRGERHVSRERGVRARIHQGQGQRYIPRRTARSSPWHSCASAAGAGCASWCQLRPLDLSPVGPA